MCLGHVTTKRLFMSQYLAHMRPKYPTRNYRHGLCHCKLRYKLSERDQGPLKKWTEHFTTLQSCFLLNYLSVISSIFIEFVQKCQYYYTLSGQSVPLVTVTSVVSLLTKQHFVQNKRINLITHVILWLKYQIILRSHKYQPVQQSWTVQPGKCRRPSTAGKSLRGWAWWCF